MLRAERVAVPVVVVGNLTVGGTGKTPVATWLARQLGLRGHQVGVVLRGYGGRSVGGARVVTADSDPAEVGDEAVLHARAGRRSWWPAPTASRPPRAAEAGADVVVCDDGLQHLRSRATSRSRSSMRRAGSATASCCPPDRCASRRRGSSEVDAVVLTERGAGRAAAWRRAGP